MYKATHIKTGIHYCLRRIHGFRLQNTKFMSLVDLWKKLNHSNIVQLKEVFTTKAFGDNSMVFVYRYVFDNKNCCYATFWGRYQILSLGTKVTCYFFFNTAIILDLKLYLISISRSTSQGIWTLSPTTNPRQCPIVTRRTTCWGISKLISYQSPWSGTTSSSWLQL